MRPAFTIGQLSLAPVDLESTIEWVLSRASQEIPCLVVTSNIHHLALAERDQVFRAVVDRAELNVADGWPLVVASRLLDGPRLPCRVAGVDLVRSVLTRRGELRVCVLGGASGAAARLAKQFGNRHNFVLVEALPVGAWESPAQLEELYQAVREAEPNLVLVALGAPKQEQLAESLRPHVKGPMICCGAAVEILAGVRPRAPMWVQRLGLEWAFRVSMEPARLLPRYVRASELFIRVLLRELKADLSAQPK